MGAGRGAGRGAVVPVLDLAHLFAVPATAVTKRSCVIIVEVRVDEQQLVMGILADAVNQVIELAPGAIEPPPAFGSRVRVDYLVGMGKMDSRKFVLILDIDRLLGDVSSAAAAASLPAPQTITEESSINA